MTICSDANLLFFSAKCFRPSSGDGGDTFSLAYRRRMFRPQCDLKEKWRAGWCLTGLRNDKGKEVGLTLSGTSGVHLVEHEEHISFFRQLS